MIPTYFLLKQLEEKYKDENIDFYWILGSDLIPGLITWDEGQKFIDETKFVVIERKGYEGIMDTTVKKDYQIPTECEIIKPEQNITGMISSTEVRNRIK